MSQLKDSLVGLTANVAFEVDRNWNFERAPACHGQLIASVLFRRLDIHIIDSVALIQAEPDFGDQASRIQFLVSKFYEHGPLVVVVLGAPYTFWRDQLMPIAVYNLQVMVVTIKLAVSFKLLLSFGEGLRIFFLYLGLKLSVALYIKILCRHCAAHGALHFLLEVGSQAIHAERVLAW